MANTRTFILLSCAFFINLCYINCLHAETVYAEAIPCPSSDILLPELIQRQSDLIKIETGLRDLLEGKTEGNASPSALFTVNLNDKDAISRRTEELTRLLKSDNNGYMSDYDNLINCAHGHENAEKTASEISDLYYRIDTLRLKFLSLPEDSRNKLIETKKESENKSAQIEALISEKEEALAQKDEARKSLQEAEKKAINETDRLSRELASERAILEKAKSDLAEVQAKSASDMEAQTKLYQNMAERLSKIEALSESDQSLDTAKRNYNEIVEIWRLLVDSTFKDSGSSFYTKKISSFPDLPAYPSGLLEKIGRSEDTRNYINSYDEVKKLREDLLAKGKTRLEENMELHYRLMIRAGKVRSQIFNILRRNGIVSIDKILSEKHIGDLFREFKVVPFRWAAIFYVKAIGVRHNLTSGIRGWIEIAEDLFFFMLFLLIPITFWLALKKTALHIEKARKMLLDESIENPHAAAIGSFLKNITPYIPWAGIVIAVIAGKKILETTVFSELEIFLPYISFYCFYRIFRIFFGSTVTKALNRSKLSPGPEKSKKIEETVRKTGLVFFISLSVLYATESMISRGIIYWLAVRIILICSAAVIVWVITTWKKELSEAIRIHHKSRFLNLMASGLEGRLSIIWSVPAFFIFASFLISYWLKTWSEKFEIYKIISATLLRKKLEGIEDGGLNIKKTLPSEYTDFFTVEVPDDTEVFISPQADILNEIRGSVEKWINGDSEGHSIAIYGDKGSGKSCLLWRLANEIKGVRIIKVSVPPRITERKDVFDFLGKYLGAETIEGAACIKEKDKSIQKTLFLIDETHNLFLGKIGGFDAFNEFLEVVNAETTNIYWCMAFNRYAWLYLYNVFGKRPYINEVIKMPSWTDKDIREMIEKRHIKTDFRVSYDKILKATGGYERFESIAQAEADYFRLIWQQSAGNPRISVHLWLSAMKHKPPYLLEAGLPEKPDISVIGRLPEDTLFIYAEILKHENLTLEEAAISSNIPLRTVNHALVLGLQNRFIEKSNDGRYRIAILFQNTLINYLTGRNFIYEQ